MKRPFEDRLAVLLQGATVATFVVACLGLFVPGKVGDAFGVSMVVVLVAAPLMRVLMLVGHWNRERDRRFVLTGLGLVALVGFGALLATFR